MELPVKKVTTRRRTRVVAACSTVLAAATLTSACTSGDPAAGGTNGSVTLTVGTFGKFGYDALYREYEKSHPKVKIVESNEGDLGKYNTQLIQRIAAGSGAGDVVAIEEGQIVNFLQSPDKFVNLQKHGIEADKANWLPWKFDAATTADGKATIGYGTDVGGLAMCYRRDLFAKAGLPTERSAVAALWPTWQDFVSVGRRFQQGSGSGKTKFIDGATNTFNSILRQGATETYFDRSNHLVVDSNPAVKGAWDTALAISNAGLSAKLKAFAPEWNAGFKNGAFATVACPAWMTGYIQDQSGAENAGKWDITTVPGGAGNWGGSYLAVPTQGKHQAQAIELAKFLTDAQGQLAAFKAVGNLPSNPKLYGEPALKDAKNAYFNGAPAGQLFAAGAQSLKPCYLGAKNQPVRDAVENALRAVENGQRDPSSGWAEAVKAATKAAK
jgi:cellobiose transport system substrate-binding protein